MNNFNKCPICNSTMEPDGKYILHTSEAACPLSGDVFTPEQWSTLTGITPPSEREIKLMDMSRPNITLKWGRLKSYRLLGVGCEQLLEEYEEVILSETKRNIKKQKELLCKIIDVCDANDVYIWWDSKYVSKSEAKEYVMHYDDHPNKRK